MFSCLAAIGWGKLTAQAPTTFNDSRLAASRTQVFTARLNSSWSVISSDRNANENSLCSWAGLLGRVACRLRFRALSLPLGAARTWRISAFWELEATDSSATLLALIVDTSLDRRFRRRCRCAAFGCRSFQERCDEAHKPPDSDISNARFDEMGRRMGRSMSHGMAHVVVARARHFEQIARAVGSAARCECGRAAKRQFGGWPSNGRGPTRPSASVR